ncbi:MAG: formylmethanofuran dehydrogenase subunit C [Nitrososphaerota archaeon]|jgi:formylmethanofuran dehydrogenase subunit C|nr:formylmethanofuran dehydrogenase subunit C [Nitrososphaerota archaeon]
MITITPKKEFTVPIQAECINADTFTGKTIEEIKKLTITEGKETITLNDAFNITEDKTTKTPNITLTGDFSKVKRIGQGMKTGEIIINGNAGMHTGEKLSGGKIIINGNAGGWTGCEMKKGTIEIHGNSGDYTASTYRGTSTGMKGGSIIIDGNVGTNVGCYLQGGIIKIKGSAGRYLGYHMSDGAIYVEKNCASRAGAFMTGGKIIINGTIELMMPTFTIDSIKPKVKIDATQNAHGPFYVFLGDIAEHGTGKIFALKTTNPTLATYETFL